MKRYELLFFFLLCAFCPGWSQDGGALRKVKDMTIYKDSAFYSAFPSVIKKENGELLVAFRRAPDRKVFREKGSNHVDPNSYLMMVRSKDDGDTWSQPELMYAHAWGGSQDPCLLLLRDGTLLCTSYGWAFLRDTEHLKKPFFENMKNTVFLGGYTIRSFDGGDQWEGPWYPLSIPDEVKYSALGDPLPAYNRGALWESEDETLYWAVAGGIRSEKPGHTSVHLLSSRDQGKTWNYRSMIAQDEEVQFNETSLYETPSGDLVAFMRTAHMNDEACVARSSDGGESFTEWKSMGFKGHPLQATRLPDNRVLLVYGYRHEPYGIRARILNEECTDYDTAEEIVIRDDGDNSDIGYPWAVVLDDRHVLITYYYNHDNGTRWIAGSLMELVE